MHGNRRIRILAIGTLLATVVFLPQGANGSDRDTLERAKQQLVGIDDDEVLPRHMTIDELRRNGEVRETLRIIPSDGDEEEATYLLNGEPVDPETDSLGRFDAVASRFEDEEAGDDSDADNDRDDGTPRFETLRGEPSGQSVTVDGIRTVEWNIAFDTVGGDVNEGTLYLAEDTGAPVRLRYDADTPILVSAGTDSYFSPDENGGLRRRLIQIDFRIGALFLSREYRMRIVY
ncbi:MAG: hypothetical protein ACOCRN_04585 [Spirochaetia bacterium]